jgi:DNA replication ATP-dependent helicase Dna2
MESLKCGLKGSQISLISPYRPQLKYLNFEKDIKNMKDHPITSTIDKYQGKDSDFVIISLVRSNENKNIGELLNDWQRLNVAFTRAKKKLILIGSKSTVLENSSFRKLKELINERSWLINLEEYEIPL